MHKLSGYFNPERKGIYEKSSWLPFLLFGGKRQLPDLILYLGTVLSPAIMAVLAVYCLKLP